MAGWDPVLVDDHRAMVACGPASAPVIESVQSLFITAANTAEATSTAPAISANHRPRSRTGSSAMD